jgi:hypothetical protein
MNKFVVFLQKSPESSKEEEKCFVHLTFCYVRLNFIIIKKYKIKEIEKTEKEKTHFSLFVLLQIRSQIQFY